MEITARYLAQEYASILRQRLGNQLHQVILFGSRARDQADEYSDVDLLVVVRKRTPHIRETVLDAGVEMINRTDRLFVPLLYDENEWQTVQNTPLGWNIQRDGIPV